MTTPVIAARALSVDFTVARPWRRRQILRALRDVDLEITAGEILGVVGESGSGKSTLARALMRLLPVSSGRIEWRGEDVSTSSGSALRRRRRHVQMIFQDPLASLNPRLRISAALSEPLEIHEPRLGAAERAEHIARMLAGVGLDAAAAQRYPRQFSGGQCQRIAIARAMMLKPELLICDEPVSSLDVSIQGQIVNLFAALREREGTAMLFISHNLALVRYLAGRVLVMYLGRVVEEADTPGLFAAPRHPYTRSLIAAMPRFAAAATAQHVPAAAPPQLLAAEPPSPLSPPSGCAFRMLCPYALDRCAREVPPLESVSATHRVACHRWRELG